MTATSPDHRAADADREHAADALAEHFAAGRLTVEEHARRTDAAYEARTVGELATLLADLPTSRRQARMALRLNTLWRAHVAVFAVVSTVAIALWALTSDLTPPAVDAGVGYYWPLWVTLVWAMLVAVHGFHAAGLLARPAARERASPSRPGIEASPALERLTERERQVIGQLARGRSNKQIALALGISERTARTHVSNILLKLGLASRTEAALLAAREGATRESPTE